MGGLEALGTKVWLYCERGLDAGFWAEPVNAGSNAAFLIAAALMLSRVHTRSATLRPKRRRALLVMIGLTALVGVGSFVFHTTATRAGQVADVVPIAAATLWAFALFLRWSLGLRRSATTAAIVALSVVSLGAVGLAATFACASPQIGEQGPQALPGICLNGSWTYVPLLGALVICALAVPPAAPSTRRWLLIAAATFAAGLAARSLDLHMCPSKGLPTLHGGWHVSAAATLYAVFRALLPSERPG